jgi:hypothetical protein
MILNYYIGSIDLPIHQVVVVVVLALCIYYRVFLPCSIILHQLATAGAAVVVGAAAAA